MRRSHQGPRGRSSRPQSWIVMLVGEAELQGVCHEGSRSAFQPCSSLCNCVRQSWNSPHLIGEPADLRVPLGAKLRQRGTHLSNVGGHNGCAVARLQGVDGLAGDLPVLAWMLCSIAAASAEWCASTCATTSAWWHKRLLDIGLRAGAAPGEHPAPPVEPLRPECARFVPTTAQKSRRARSRAATARGRKSRASTSAAAARSRERPSPQCCSTFATPPGVVAKSSPWGPQPSRRRMDLPVASSARWQPAAQTSSRSSKGAPARRSGEKYCGHPATCDISRGAVAATASADVERP
mmetsp:Transcript_18824/g.53589  ORF Transcript_18824/g.53589 Transcript_18824/m.53589 type:complete len:294 (+) Transcript_18824:351-1232(+)